MVLFTFSPPHPSPFGMLMPNRDWSAGSGDGYRFGFGGQEQVDEVYGNGNLNTAMFWEYDPRLGRRWNIDPIVKHFEAPYTSFGNNPIFFSDLLGNDKTDYYDIGSGEHLEHVEDGIDEAVGINRNNFNGLKADGNLSNANAKAAGGIGLGSNTAFVALAATIYAESSDFAPKEEAYALGTQFVNLASGANVSLDKMVTNANDQLYGVGSNKYNKFKSTDGSQVNPLFSRLQ
ncbi:MAG: hypothetical protein IPG60_07600 [Bacteroidetes bacterium]|nr:hypothetical protein [Bacteroidota bacterium]